MSAKNPKGKQATKGKKQIAEENKSTLNFYFYIICGANIFYYAVWYLFFWDTFTSGPIFMSIMSAAIYFCSLQFMTRMGKSVYHEGQLVDSGVDLNMEAGMAEHTKDLILLTAIVQTCTLLSSYFWLFLLLAPGRAFYMLWVNFLGPWFFAPAEDQAVDEKKQKKMERKMKRQQVIR
uniref:Transmembrane protein 208 n=1 Tax=Arion vulgaris TaxID=1028688 RepID=A0A0B6ZK41_9EUPU